MTFSEFAKVMYTGSNECSVQAAFVVHLTNQIMGGQPGRTHEVDGKKVYQNPLANKEDRRRLYEYFEGEKSISKKDASAIYSSIDPDKFAAYVERRYSRSGQLVLFEECKRQIQPRLTWTSKA